MAPPEEIILYQYAFSPYARKVTNYMKFRNIPYNTVEQPPMLPRPDLNSYGIHYRRIPVMSIGRDFYCDTPLIFAKLDELFPSSAEHPQISANTGPDQALEYLIQKWANEVMFMKACKTIPPDFGPLQDPKFLKDRAEIWGDEWQEGVREKIRADGLKDVDDAFSFLDSVVGDGRNFVFGEKPGTADIHALFLFDWLLELVPGSLPEEILKGHPKTVAWRERFHKAVEDATAKSSAKDIAHSDASTRILNAGFAEPEGEVDARDPVAEYQKLKKGTKVNFYPTDAGGSGPKYQDSGELLKLTATEASLVTKTADSSKEIRIHVPRWNFKIEAANGS